jgi:hypothetical protein
VTIPTRTRAQLVSRAYAILGLAEVGQSEDEDSLAVIDDFVEPLFARLNAEKITWHVDAEGNVTQLDDPDAIPAKAFIDLAVLLAFDAMADFGLAVLPPPLDGATSEMRLRTVWAVKEATQEEYETTVVDLDTDAETTVTHRRNETLRGEYW